jgi:hypothetical protein
MGMQGKKILISKFGANRDLETLAADERKVGELNGNDIRVRRYQLDI